MRSDSVKAVGSSLSEYKMPCKPKQSSCKARKRCKLAEEKR